MTFCTHCGKPLQDGSQFCVYCGKALQDLTVKPAHPGASAGGTTPPAYPPAQETGQEPRSEVWPDTAAIFASRPQQPPQKTPVVGGASSDWSSALTPPETPPRKKGGKILLWILLGLLLLGGAGFALWHFFLKKDSPAPTEPPVETNAPVAEASSGEESSGPAASDTQPAESDQASQPADTTESPMTTTPAPAQTTAAETTTVPATPAETTPAETTSEEQTTPAEQTTAVPKTTTAAAADLPREGIVAVSVEYGARYVYNSTGTYAFTPFTARFYLIDPVTEESVLWKSFSSEESHSCSLSADLYEPIDAGNYLNADWTRLTATRTMEDGAVHVGWIDEAGRFTDISRMLVTQSDFGSLTNHDTPKFWGNYFYYVDRSDSNGIVCRVPLDNIGPDAVEVVDDNLSWLGWEILPDGSIEDSSSPFVYFNRAMRYRAYSARAEDWISSSAAVGTNQGMIYRYDLFSNDEWEKASASAKISGAKEQTALIPSVKNRQNENPAVSPDGSQVAFLSRLTAGTDQNRHLFVVPSQGGNPVEIKTDLALDELHLIGWKDPAALAEQRPDTPPETTTVADASTEAPSTEAPEETDPLPAAVPLTSLKYDDIEVGMVVTFGSYEQDNNRQNGAEDIEWIIYWKGVTNIYMISRYVLDAVPFSSVNKSTTFAGSNLDYWLQGSSSSFLDKAFTNMEKSFLAEQELDKPKNERYPKTVQTEFLYRKAAIFSINEIIDYLPEEFWQASGTEYALSRGLEETDGFSPWWTRTMGQSGNYAGFVNELGELDYAGRVVNDDSMGVRPVISFKNDTFR